MENDEEHELSQIVGRQSTLIKWMMGGTAGLLIGAFTVGAWTSANDSAIKKLQSEDVLFKQDLRDEQRLSREAEGRLKDEIRQADKTLAEIKKDISFISDGILDIKTRLQNK